MQFKILSHFQFRGGGAQGQGPGFKFILTYSAELDKIITIAWASAEWGLNLVVDIYKRLLHNRSSLSSTHVTNTA